MEGRWATLSLIILIFKFLVLFQISVLIFYGIGVEAKNLNGYFHLGCYRHTASNVDLEYGVIGTANVTDCIESCRKRGYTYAGIARGGIKCYCGERYGKFEKSQGCITNCLDSSLDTCGGNEENDVFYTIPKLSSCPNGTLHIVREPADVCWVLHKTTVARSDAQKACAKQNADFVAVTGEDARGVLNRLLAESSMSDSSVWIGLRRFEWEVYFHWNSVYENSFNSKTFKAYWESSYPDYQECVIHNGRTNLWETKSCGGQYLFACQYTLDHTSYVPYRNGFSGFLDRLVSYYGDKNNLAMFLILPFIGFLFFFCLSIYFCHLSFLAIRRSTKPNKVEPEKRKRPKRSQDDRGVASGSKKTQKENDKSQRESSSTSHEKSSSTSYGQSSTSACEGRTSRGKSSTSRGHSNASSTKNSSRITGSVTPHQTKDTELSVAPEFIKTTNQTKTTRVSSARQKGGMQNQSHHETKRPQSNIREAISIEEVP